ncbi:MAG: endonuclease domain-containing protein [Gammaproteobacteria bacterium]|nr:endonuclease domain-containing protein [Gammaproteobacteria bacterium]
MNKTIQIHARKNRLNLTSPEKKIWQQILSRKQTGYKFLRQHPIGHYIPDFYCRVLKLIIEIDGDSHCFQEEYDLKRTAYFESRKLKVIRFNNRDVLYNIEGVEDVILQEITKIIE